MVEEAGIELELLEGVFYNPRMRINRDITEAFVVKHGIKSYADIMAASGIRGFRIARHGVETRLNDKSIRAYATILWNSQRLGLNVNATRMDAKEFLLEYKGIEFIDLDPFGTPAPYLPAVVEYKPKYLGVTATDTANLCGKYPHASRRLYFVENFKTPFCHEVGIRILLYAIAREAARNDMIIEPLVSYSYRHHMRVIVRLIRASSTAIDRMLTNEIGRLRFDPDTYRIKISEGIAGSGIGPIRIGDIGNPFSIEPLIGYKRNSEETNKILRMLLIDSRAPIGYYDLHEIARIRKESPVSKRKLLEKAREMGIFLSETHFSPRAVKGVNVDAVIEVIEALRRQGGP